LAPHAQALASEPAPSETDLTASQTDGTQVAQQVDTIGTASFELQLLPELPLEARLGATVKAVSVNNATAQGELAPDSGEARIGKATHRLIEWLPVCTGGYAALAAGNTKSGCRTPHWSDAQRASVATQFTLDAAQLAPAVQMAQSIVTGAGAWAWDADQLQWRHNEVPISRGGRLLRIDRLVQTRSDG
jgi:ATP-dependent helicase/nuclease subunit A